MARLNISMNSPPEEEPAVAASPSGDIDVKLLKMQEEMDLVKTSIKKLLIDIRDRLNEKDNPFLRGNFPAKPMVEENPAEEEKPEEVIPEEEGEEIPGSQMTVQEELANMLRNKGKMPPAPFGSQKMGEKLRLRKVHRLFGWTSKIINRYGHDRLEILLQAYTSMGYLTDEMAGQIREVGRLLPASLGEVHVVGPDEFVSELYILNRILDPKDNTLDEDMIEVLMTHRIQSPGAPVLKKPGKAEGDQVFEWIDSMDRT